MIGRQIQQINAFDAIFFQVSGMLQLITILKVVSESTLQTAEQLWRR